MDREQKIQEEAGLCRAGAIEDSPEDGELVLAMVDDGRITVARAYSRQTCEKIYVQWNAEYIPLFGEHYITHWMPIPELTFDDILDANKDVLKRIKENGD